MEENNMQKYLFTLTIGAIGFAMVMSGCAKRMKTETSAMQEEQVAAARDIGEPVNPMDSPSIQEEDVMGGGMGGLVDVYFDFDRFNIRGDMRASMETNVKWLRSNPDVSVTIEGHADERGTNEYNLALGERRAQATKRFLIAAGIEASQISTISYGEERPMCMNSNESCYSKNRRAHFATRGR
jgi:peptidoglycan-associated lipoprotein